MIKLPDKNSLGSKFLTKILLFSSFITLCLTSYQLYSDYSVGKDQLTHGFKNLSEPDKEIISTSLWFIDKSQIMLELHSLVKIPGVKQVKIKTVDGDIYATGELDGVSSIQTYYFDLVYKGNKVPQKVGVLELVGTFDSLKESLIDKGVIILLGQAFKTFAVSFFILFIYVNLIGRRLSKIASFAGRVGIKSLDEKLEVNTRNPDELDEISKTINSMTERLSTQLYSLEVEQESKLKLEKKFYEDQKVKALGTLAGGISHDFKNILQSMLMVSDIIESSFESGKTPKKELDTLRRITGRAQDLIDKILLFSRNEKINIQSIDISKIGHDSIDLFKLSMLKDIKLKVDIPSHELYIKGDRVQINQLLLNLLGNASQAFNRSHSLKEVSLKISQIHESDEILLKVSDNGIGIPKAIQEKMFDPFFTTKEVGKGTGLGLSISKTVVENHNGRIEVSSIEGSGTSFEVYLPITL